MMCVDWHWHCVFPYQCFSLCPSSSFLLQPTKSLLVQVETLLKYTHLQVKAFAHILNKSFSYTRSCRSQMLTRRPDPSGLRCQWEGAWQLVGRAGNLPRVRTGRRRHTQVPFPCGAPPNLSNSPPTNHLFVITCFHGIISPITIWSMGNPSHSWGFGLSTEKYIYMWVSPTTL